MSLLEASHISKSFGKKQVLKDVSFSLGKSEIIGLYGRNGCGKSTLLKILFGTLKADSISLKIKGAPIMPKTAQLKQQLAYIPQHPFLPMAEKIRDIIPMYISGQEQDKVFYDDYIASFASRKVSELSLGQRRYFEVVLIANGSHPIIMIDEPFSMLEPMHKERLKNFIVKTSKSKGILITDHYYKDIMAIATKNIVLVDGVSISIENEDDLFNCGYLSHSLK